MFQVVIMFDFCNICIMINFFKEIFNSHKKNLKGKKQNILIYQIIRDSINLMVKDLINNTIRNINKNKIKSISNVKNWPNQLVHFSNNFVNIENEIRTFLKLKMYNNPKVLRKNNEGKKIVKKLFEKIKTSPTKFIPKDKINHDKYRTTCDFISGMTDRYAINLYNKIK